VSRIIETFLNVRLLAGLVLAVVMSMMLTPTIARRLRVVRGAAYLSALTVTGIVAVTIIERAAGLPGFDLGRALTWWTTVRQSPLEVARTETAWRLNVVLFVPAGVVWGGVTRRPFAVAVALLAFSIGIETVQGLTGLGAADLTDVTANAVGGVLGAMIIAVVLRFTPDVVTRLTSVGSDTDEQFDARWLVGVVVATLLAVGVGFGSVQAVLIARQRELRTQAEATYDGVTVSDINELVTNSDAVGLDPFFILEAGSPDSYQFLGDDRPIEIRYPTDLLGFYRCVFVTISQAPPVFSDASGEPCTEDRFPD
jgi:hypothetical protein